MRIVAILLWQNDWAIIYTDIINIYTNIIGSINVYSWNRYAYIYAGKVQLSLVCQMLINVNVKTFSDSYM